MKSQYWACNLAARIMIGAAFPLVLGARAAEGPPAGRMGAGMPAPVVGTVAARKGDIGVYVSALGMVTPLATVLIKSRVDGQLMSVNYTEGQMIKAGEALVEIDPRPYQAQLTQAEGQLARDKALLENANVDLDRYEIAYRSNAIPKQQLDTQAATVHQYEGSVKLDQGQVDSAKLQITYAHINAPISGRVGLRLVDSGNIVHATDTNPLAVITQLQPITVLFGVPEDDVPAIQQQLSQGQKLPVEAYDRAQVKKLATGTLLTTDNQIDVNTGTLKLKAVFTNEDLALFPNQFVNVRLLVTTKRGATLVPMTAIQHNAQTAFVYVVQTNQTIALRPVTVGTSDEAVAAIEGVEPGEVIVADNFNRLIEGMKVEVRKPGEEGKPGRRKPADLAAESPSKPSDSRAP